MQWTTDKRLLYSPSDLITYMESDFASWMDRLYKLFPRQYTPDIADENTRILQKLGNQHERKFLSTLREQGRKIIEVAEDRDCESAIIQTKKAIESGFDIIYQGVLSLFPFQGRSDFLVRQDGVESNLGNYCYEVWDTKLARKTKPYFIIQLCCYAEMLQHLQGRLPENIAVVLGSGKIEHFRTCDYFSFYKALKESFLEFHENFDETVMPANIQLSPFSRWKTLGERILEERDDLCRVANIRQTQIKKLHAVGITTMKELSSTKRERIPDLDENIFQTLKQQARLQIESAALDKPSFEILSIDSEAPRKGLALLPPSSPNDVFFDMEGYPHFEGGLEYLFGATFVDQNNEVQFADWWAHDTAQEKIAFEQFTDWAFNRWKSDPSMHIFHYASYEVSAMRRLMGRYGTREHEIDELLRNEVFVDLSQIVRQSLCIGEPSYSIKNVEHLYMESRKGVVAKATDSVVFYERWLESEESEEWKQSPLLRDIRDYNKEDCVSTLLLARWLWKLQTTNKIHYIQKVSTEDEESARTGTAIKAAGLSTREEAANLMREMLDEIPPDVVRYFDSLEETNNFSKPANLYAPDVLEHWRLQRLLAFLLCFHEREDKPVFWAMYDRHTMTEEELWENMDCLAALQRERNCQWAQPTGLRKNSPLLYEFKFDPAQDTRLSAGDDVFFAHDLYQSARIDMIDTDSGRIKLRLSPVKPEPAERLSIIPKELVGLRTIADSILRTVLTWRRTKQLPPAIKDFLLRHEPRIIGRAPGQQIVGDKASLDEIADAIGKLQDSTISVQGPPGSGKTYTGSAVIAQLLKQGFRIGITSNSHAAIEHFMRQIVKRCMEEKVPCQAMKIKLNEPHPGIESCESAKALYSGDYESFNLIGGTAYAFSHELAQDTLDFLFVDEAGQVSIANLVGVAPSTRNIILLGDQMQLDQPIQGHHPGESGQSTLEYLLNGCATVPQHMGIFLNQTWRMRPELCRVVSSVVYEDRLHAHPSTADRLIIAAPKSVQNHLKRTNGILYVPVVHEGNTQGSPEEAQVIAEIISELCTMNLVTKSQTRICDIKDILVVAPYNMQVRLIKNACPSGVRVASVDKFQGQEAPIVILSMCTSDGGTSPRGMEFIFSQNRLNVAVSRAQCLAIIVGNPALASTKCNTVRQMKLANFFCRLVDEGHVDETSTNKTKAELLRS